LTETLLPTGTVLREHLLEDKLLTLVEEGRAWTAKELAAAIRTL